MHLNQITETSKALDPPDLAQNPPRKRLYPSHEPASPERTVLRRQTVIATNLTSLLVPTRRTCLAATRLRTKLTVVTIKFLHNRAWPSKLWTLRSEIL